MSGNIVTVFGSLFIVVGAVLLAGPVYGFTSMAADRGVSMETASGEGAYIGGVPGDSTIDGPNDEAEVAAITNNLESDITVLEVDVAFSSGGDDLEATVPETLGTSDTASVLVACSSRGGPRGSETTTATVTVEEAIADGVTITGVTVESDLTYECNPGGNSGPPDNPGNSGTTIGDSELEDGDVNADGDVTSGWDSEITGDVDAGSDVSTGDSSTVGGNIDADGTVTMGWDSEVGGDVDAGGDISTGDSSTVGGDIDADGSVTTGWDSDVGGDVTAGGDVITGGSSTVGGDITAGGDVATGESSTVDGDITADEDVTTGDSSTVTGKITADGDVETGWNSEVGDDITAGGDVIIGGDSTISGDVSADGDVVVKWGAIVEGNIDADGTTDISDGAVVEGDING